MKTMTFMLFTCFCLYVFGQGTANTTTGQAATSGTTVPTQPGATPSTTTTAASPTRNPASPAVKANPVRVTRIVRYQAEKDSTTVAIGDRLKICLNKEGMDSIRKLNYDVHLWMNGTCLRTSRFVVAKDDYVIFRLLGDTSKTSPFRCLNYSWPDYMRFRQQVYFSIGTATKEFDAANREPLDLKTGSKGLNLTIYAVFGIVILALLFFSGSLLRDAGLYAKNGIDVSTSKPTDSALSTINIKDVPFSLARTQFLFWLLIIFISIVHIWVFTGYIPTPSGTTLILLTLSGTTLYIGKKIDGQPAAGASEAAAFQAGKLQKADFITDILCDGTTISLHRLQLLLFTAFLGIYFVVEVATSLRMPDFDSTMMALMGISGATYVGMKTTE